MFSAETVELEGTESVETVGFQENARVIVQAVPRTVETVESGGAEPVETVELGGVESAEMVGLQETVRVIAQVVPRAVEIVV